MTIPPPANAGGTPKEVITMFKKSLCLLLTGLMLLSVICGCNSEQNPGESSGISLETNDTAATEATEATEPEPTNGEKPPQILPFTPPDETFEFINGVYVLCENENWDISKVGQQSLTLRLITEKPLPEDATIVIPDCPYEYSAGITEVTETVDKGMSFLTLAKYIYITEGYGDNLKKYEALQENLDRLTKLAYGDDGAQVGEIPAEEVLAEYSNASKAKRDFEDNYLPAYHKYKKEHSSLGYHVYSASIILKSFSTDQYCDTLELMAGDMSRNISVNYTKRATGTNESPVGYRKTNVQLPASNLEAGYQPRDYFTVTDSDVNTPWTTDLVSREIFKLTATESFYFTGVELKGKARTRISIDHFEIAIMDKNENCIVVSWKPEDVPLLVRKGEQVVIYIYYTDTHLNQWHYCSDCFGYLNYECKDKTYQMRFDLDAHSFPKLEDMYHMHKEGLDLKDFYQNYKGEQMIYISLD